MFVTAPVGRVDERPLPITAPADAGRRFANSSSRTPAVGAPGAAGGGAIPASNAATSASVANSEFAGAEASSDDTSEAVVATAGPIDSPFDDAPVSWPDDAAESSFIAEAKQRGEPVKASTAAAEIIDEKDTKSLPPMADLLARITPEVREALEELFRAKFTVVRRTPKKWFKSEDASSTK